VSRFLTAQIGYTVLLTSLYARKYRQKTNQKQTLLKLSTTQKKPTTRNTAKQNYPGSVASYDTRPGNEVGLFYNAPEPTRDKKHVKLSKEWANKCYQKLLQLVPVQPGPLKGTLEPPTQIILCTMQSLNEWPRSVYWPRWNTSWLAAVGGVDLLRDSCLVSPST